MRRWGWFSVLGAVAILAGHPPAVRAELLRFAFRGHVYFATSDGPLNPPAILPGDAFTGSFSYDPNSPPAPVTPSPPTFFSPGEVSLHLPGWDLHSDPTRPMYLSLNAVQPPHGDWFSVTGQVPDPGLIGAPVGPGFLGLFFFNKPGRSFSGIPPARLDLSELDGAMLALTYPSRTFPNDFALPSLNLSGGVDEVTADDSANTPEPGTFLLGVLGALVCGLRPALRVLGTDPSVPFGRRPRVWFLAAAACGALAGWPAGLRADFLHFTFRGHVNYLFGDGSPHPPAISPGDAFTGSFSYDPNSPVTSSAIPPFFSAYPPGQIALHVDGWDFHSDPTGQLTLSFSVDPYSSRGILTSAFGQVPDPGLFDPPPFPGFISLLTPTFPALGLPGTPPTQPTTLILAFPSRTYPYDITAPSFDLNGNVDEVTADDSANTPEPGTLALGLFGVLAFGGPFAFRAFRNRPRAVKAYFVTGAVLALASSPAFAGPLTFNAAADFAPDRNPNGPWGYGWSAALGSPFHPFTLHYNFTGLGLDFWNAPADPSGFADAASAAGVLHNGTDRTIAMLNSIWSPGRLGLQPGFHGEYSIVRWTAPAGGRVAVRATFSGLDYGATTTDVHVLRNGSALFDGAVNGYEGSGTQSLFGTTLDSTPFGFLSIKNPGPRIDSQSVRLPSVAVSRGDTIDFAVGFGGDRDAASDSTGLEAIIAYGPLTDAPEPGTLTLTAAGLLGLGCVAVRRHRGEQLKARPAL